MKHWMQKIFVALIAVLTLGMYVPQVSFDLDHEDQKGEMTSKAGTEDRVYAEPVSEGKQDMESVLTFDVPASPHESEAEILKRQAREQAAIKLGPRITKRIDMDFNTDILPEIEEVLDVLLDEAGQTTVPYYSITQHPASGLGEMMFNVYDERSQTDVARFHVRRDNRPQEGYWFNFHYHLHTDQFQTHYTIGEIYWDKNTPPHWMA